MRLPFKRVFFGLVRSQLPQQMAFPFLHLAQLLRYRAEFLEQFLSLLFQLGDFFLLRYVLKRANKGLCQQYPLASHSTAAPWSEPLAEPCSSTEISSGVTI